MGKSEGPCCVLTLPLKPELWQIDIIETRFKIMEHLKNSLIALELRKLKNIERTRTYKNLIEEINEAEGEEKKKLYIKRKKLLLDAGFSKNNFIKDITPMQKHFVEHFAAQIAHRCSWDVWGAFEKMLFGTGKRVHYIRKGTLNSIGCENIGNGMNYRDGYFEWNGGRCKNQICLKIKVENPETEYEKKMLLKKKKTLRIVRKWSKTKYRYYLQITYEGTPVQKDRKVRIGKRVGIDIGTSTVAVVAESATWLLELADRIKLNHNKKIFLQQHMDRSRRVMNSDNFNDDGTVKRGKKLSWVYSKSYQDARCKVRELERKNAAIREYQHICLANNILALGTEIYVESMSFAGLQHRAKETTYNEQGRMNKKKRFGKSLANRAPAKLLTILDKKLVNITGNGLHKVNTQKFKASQYDHVADAYKRKTLNDRWMELKNGDRVQRDLYSAFLLMNSEENMEKADKELCEKTYNNFKKLHDKEIYRIKNSGNKYPRSFGIA